MKKALIICAAGMSSSLIAAKASEKLKEMGEDIIVDAVSANFGEEKIKQKEFDLYLVSPQTKMMLAKFEEYAKNVGVKVVLIPFDHYIPIPMAIKKFAKLVVDNI